MIPKIIHYCWFGGNEKPESVINCINSWKKFCPDYEIKEWNESNVDISATPLYTRQAYEMKKWAFVTDYVRLKVLYDFGGIYMDTDVEVIKNLDCLLEYKAVSGFESTEFIPTGLIAAEKRHKAIFDNLDKYNDFKFVKKNGELNLTTNVMLLTDYFEKLGLIRNNTLQTVNDFTFLPSDYLCPKNSLTRELNITENTLAIHHFDGSWLSDERRYIMDMYADLIKKYPHIIARIVSAVVGSVKFRGFLGIIKKTFKYMGKKIRKEI